MKVVPVLILMLLQLSNTAYAIDSKVDLGGGRDTLRVTCERELSRPEAVEEAISDSFRSLFYRPFVVSEVIAGVKPAAFSMFGFQPGDLDNPPNRIFVLEPGRGEAAVALTVGDFRVGVWKTVATPDFKMSKVVAWKRADVQKQELSLDNAAFMEKHFAVERMEPGEDNLSYGVSAPVRPEIRRYILAFVDSDLFYLQLGLDVPCNETAAKIYGNPEDHDPEIVRREDGEFCRIPILLLATPHAVIRAEVTRLARGH